MYNNKIKKYAHFYFLKSENLTDKRKYVYKKNLLNL